MVSKGLIAARMSLNISGSPIWDPSHPIPQFIKDLEVVPRLGSLPLLDANGDVRGIQAFLSCTIICS